jgi:hypothetical protein
LYLSSIKPSYLYMFRFWTSHHQTVSLKKEIQNFQLKQIILKGWDHSFVTTILNYSMCWNNYKLVKRKMFYKYMTLLLHVSV